MQNVDVDLVINALRPGNPVPVGYHRAKDSAGIEIAYYYAFTGGNTTAKDGTVEVIEPGKATTIKLKLKGVSSGKFDIMFAVFKDSPMAGIKIDAKGKNKVSIVNPASESGTCSYSVVATTKIGDDYIYCDPRIENSWDVMYPKQKLAAPKQETTVKKQPAAKKAVKKAVKKAASGKAGRKK